MLALSVVGPSLGRHLPYIIGGTEAEVGQWKWQGSLEYNRRHNCGCVLISVQWALTAAHCVGGSINSYSSTFGVHNRNNWNIGNPTNYGISSIIRHKDYVSGGVFPNDIAAIKFTSNVQLNDYVRPVMMAPRNTLYDNMNCWISGWGKTQTGGGGGLPYELRQAEVSVVDKATCRKYWTVDDKHVCIGKKGSRGACQGDSGGPLVCYINDHYEFVGITSFVRVGCYTDWPSVYTSVSYHRDWIQEHTGL